MTLWHVLISLAGLPILFGGLLYAVFSRLWFTYLPWSVRYNGAFSERFIGPRAKLRSAVIRFLAGCLMSVLVGLMARVLQLTSLAAFLKLGVFISLGIVAVSLVQYANGDRHRRYEIILETLFQLVAMEGICLVWSLWPSH